VPWEPTTFIFRGYNPYIGGLKLKTLHFSWFWGRIIPCLQQITQGFGHSSTGTRPRKPMEPMELETRDPQVHLLGYQSLEPVPSFLEECRET